MDYLAVTMMTCMALFAVMGAYAAGWVRGYSQREEEYRWNRWLILRAENRRTRL